MAGYSGDGAACSAEGPCEQVDTLCQNGGECFSTTANDYVCDCNFGFSGDECQFKDSECYDEQCQNGAVCVDVTEDITDCYNPASCENSTCYDAVCAADNACCDGFWDQYCQDCAEKGESSFGDCSEAVVACTAEELTTGEVASGVTCACADGTSGDTCECNDTCSAAENCNSDLGICVSKCGECVAGTMCGLDSNSSTQCAGDGAAFCGTVSAEDGTESAFTGLKCDGANKLDCDENGFVYASVCAAGKVCEVETDSWGDLILSCVDAP
jgi:hypothetical protein